MKKEREIQLDVIKVIASLMVIVLHLGNIYLRSDYFVNRPDYQWIGHFCSITMRLCVPLFVMVSGYLFFRKKDPLDLIHYYKNTLKRIIFPTILASVFYSMLTGLQQLIFTGKIKTEVLLENLYTGNVYSHLWYMYMVVGLYLIAPLFHSIYRNVRKQTFLVIGVGLTGVGMLSAFLFDLPWPLLFLQYVGYFVMGKALHDVEFVIKKKWLVSVGIILWIGVYVISVMQRAMHFYEGLQLYKYLSPFTVVSSWILYYVMVRFDFKNVKQSTRERITELSSSNLWIYLIHQFYLDVIYHWILRDNSVYLHPILFIPILCVVVYCVSFYSTRVFNSMKLR